MSLSSAQQFVARMKEDKEFRRKVQSLPNEEALKDFIKAQGYEFDQNPSTLRHRMKQLGISHGRGSKRFGS